VRDAETPDQRRYLEAPALPEAPLCLRAQGLSVTAAGKAPHSEVTVSGHM
jgi:hypothetical protein